MSRNLQDSVAAALRLWLLDVEVTGDWQPRLRDARCFFMKHPLHAEKKPILEHGERMAAFSALMNLPPPHSTSQ